MSLTLNVDNNFKQNDLSLPVTIITNYLGWVFMPGKSVLLKTDTGNL